MTVRVWAIVRFLTMEIKEKYIILRIRRGDNRWSVDSNKHTNRSRWWSTSVSSEVYENKFEDDATWWPI